MISRKNQHNLLIILVIIYLIIYYLDKFIFVSNKNNINEKIIEPTLNNQEKIIINENQSFNNNILSLESDNSVNSNQAQISDKSIQSTDNSILTQLSNIITLKSTNNSKLNSDGSDLTNYIYKTCMLEGFANTIESDKIKAKYPPIKTPRYIWVYWENINRSNYPTHIKLCLDTIKKHLGTKYKLVLLNEKTIKEYLPEIRADFDNLMVAQKVDYYRIALLHKYGGIWLDADIIVMKDLEPIFKKLDEGYDYVGFGCTGGQCSNGKFKPSNWVLGARPQSVLMELVLSKLNKKLDSRDKNVSQNDDTYHDYGKMVIWEALDDLKPQGYDYYHFTSEYDGTRDSNKYWVHNPNFFNTSPTKLLDESKVLFMVLYNSEITGEPKNHWVKDCDESQLLYSKIWLGELYRKGLGII